MWQEGKVCCDLHSKQLVAWVRIGGGGGGGGGGGVITNSRIIIFLEIDLPFHLNL